MRFSRALQATLVVLLAASTAHAAGGLGGARLDAFFADWVHGGLMVAAAAICAARAVRVERERLAWAWAASALALYALGEVSWALLYQRDASPPFPSLSDGFWLAFYPAIYVALVLLARERLRRFHASLWMDGAIAALAVAGVGAALVFDPVLAATGGQNPAAVATTLAYPLGDLVLLGIVISVFALTGWRPGRSWAFIGGALALNAIADVVYAYGSAKGTWVDGSIYDVLFPAAALLLARAAWEPTRDTEIRLEGARLLVVPFAFATVGFGLTAYAIVDHVNAVASALAVAVLFAVLARTGMTFLENLRILRHFHDESLTDALTGLGNRRRLLEDLDRALAEATPAHGWTLALFDLDGFKRYNDTFGHPAGDALLSRLGRRLTAMAARHGTVYRLGGDEFCLLVRQQPGSGDALVAAAAVALREEGEGFAVTCSHGSVAIPQEAQDASRALQLADRRMYGQKSSRPASAGRQTRDVLLRVLREREPELHRHMHEVARLAAAVGRRLAMSAEELDEVARAAELHDVGKMAIPDAILDKPGPLEPDEVEFVRRHTIVGERILGAAAALAPVARLVRASHEHVDGQGYPDGLAGDDIPLGARVIAVCDAYAAMTEDRPYRGAMPGAAAVAELRRCAGTQFDPLVVELFVAEVRGQMAETATRSVESKSLRDSGFTAGDVAPESR